MRGWRVCAGRRQSVRNGYLVRVSLVWAVAIASACGGSEGGVGRSGGNDVAEVLSLVETLGGLDTAGYARALEVRDFTFTADHGPHPDFQSEWWYFTGVLRTEDGERIGYQATWFRTGLVREAPPRRSRLAARSRSTPTATSG